MIVDMIGDDKRVECMCTKVVFIRLVFLGKCLNLIIAPSLFIRYSMIYDVYEYNLKILCVRIN